MSWGENLSNSTNGGKKRDGGKKQNNKWKNDLDGKIRKKLFVMFSALKQDFINLLFKKLQSGF